VFSATLCGSMRNGANSTAACHNDSGSFNEEPYLFPVRIRLTTTPCYGRPVRVGMPTSFIRAAMRSNPRPSARSAFNRSMAGGEMVFIETDLGQP